MFGSSGVKEKMWGKEKKIKKKIEAKKKNWFKIKKLFLYFTSNLK